MKASGLRDGALRAVSVLLVLALAAAVWVGLAGRLPFAPVSGSVEPVSALYLDWEYGVGEPHQRLMTGPDYAFRAQTNPYSSSIEFQVQDLLVPSEWWQVQVGPGNGRRLEVGEYNAAQSRIGVSPNLSLMQQCSNSAGRFVIHQVEMVGTVEVSRLAMSFEVHCAGSYEGPHVPAVFGVLLYNATNVDWAGLIITPSATFASPGSAAAVSVTNVGTIPQDLAARITGVDSADFTIEQNTCATLAPGASCTISMRFRPVGAGSNYQYLPPRLGTREAFLKVTDQTAAGEHVALLTGQNVDLGGVALSVAANPVKVGTQVELHATVTDAADQVEIFDGDQQIAAQGVVSGAADFRLSLATGTHWLKASIVTPTGGRIESYPLRIVVQP